MLVLIKLSKRTINILSKYIITALHFGK